MKHGGGKHCTHMDPPNDGNPSSTDHRLESWGISHGQTDRVLDIMSQEINTATPTRSSGTTYNPVTHIRLDIISPTYTPQHENCSSIWSLYTCGIAMNNCPFEG